MEGVSVDNIDEVRDALEDVAKEFGDGIYPWQWDETKMHLTISDSEGNPIATLHVEYAN